MTDERDGNLFHRNTLQAQALALSIEARGLHTQTNALEGFSRQKLITVAARIAEVREELGQLSDELRLEIIDEQKMLDVIGRIETLAN